MYGAETWTLTKTLETKIDGCYTKLLRYALGVKWQDRVRNEDLYGTLPRVSEKIRHRRLQFAGHCFRAKDQPVSDLVFWVPSGKLRRGKGATRTYPKSLELDTGRTIYELQKDMLDRKEWRKQIRN